jgi:hypothetical protein
MMGCENLHPKTHL